MGRNGEDKRFMVLVGEWGRLIENYNHKYGENQYKIEGEPPLDRGKSPKLAGKPRATTTLS